jgi:transcription termination factor Rho
MDNQYDSMTLANLREIAKEKGLKNITSYKKSELIEAIRSTSPEEKKDTSNETEQKADKLSYGQSVQRQGNRTQSEQPQRFVKEERTQPEPLQGAVKEEKTQSEPLQGAAKESIRRYCGCFY